MITVTSSTKGFANVKDGKVTINPKPELKKQSTFDYPEFEAKAVKVISAGNTKKGKEPMLLLDVEGLKQNLYVYVGILLADEVSSETKMFRDSKDGGVDFIAKKLSYDEDNGFSASE